jgi:hypothetical protein
MRLQGTVTSSWSIPNSRLFADSCNVESIAGSGSERDTFATSRSGVGMRVVYGSGDYLIELPYGVRQPGVHHFVRGFGAADAVRRGKKATRWTRASSWTSSCYAPPADTVADTRGCGERHVPWFAEPSDIRNQLNPGPALFAPVSMTLQCPGSDVTWNRTGSVYPPANTRVPASRISALMASRHGKLSVSGHRTWHASKSFGYYTETVTSSQRWKLTLTRVH